MKKGMSTTLVIVVAAVVILVTALMVILVFTGGIENFLNIFNPWSQDTAINAQCQTKCQAACINTKSPPSPWTVNYDKAGDGIAEAINCETEQGLKCSCI